jgi:uncharacterized protein (TIGR02646 family)
MIRIHRANTPAVLMSRGTVRTLRDCAAYEADPDAYRRGEASFEASPTIYGHKTVKATLLNSQHEKCCYCERKILASGFGDVEHFRPKGGVQQDPNSAEERPGYYWLAYQWSNLLVSCSVCNTKWKRTFFPLEDPLARARSHLEPVENERPLLVDPTAEDPRDHIRFDGDAPYALTPRGQATIERLNLRRGDLLERRQALLRSLTFLRGMVEALGPDAPESLETMAYMQSLAESSGEFSAMVIDFLAAPFVPASTAPVGGSVSPNLPPRTATKQV